MQAAKLLTLKGKTRVQLFVPQCSHIFSTGCLN
jgi:hypothetical protein